MGRVVRGDQLMPDLTGFPALDVAIGLAFLFFLLSTVCSIIQEAISAFFGWRAKTLEDALARMLGDKKVQTRVSRGLNKVKAAVRRRPPEESAATKAVLPGDLASQVLGHWAITGLVQNPSSRWRRRRRPSYLPPDVVSLAVSEVVAANDPASTDEKETPWAKTDHELMAA